MITRMEITVLVNNFVFRSGMKGEHGLSLLLNIVDNGSKRQILWDTGQTQETLLFNLSAINEKLNDLTTVVLSHGHYDHTGGLLGLLDYIDNKVEVFASELTWGDRFNNSNDLKPIGSGVTPDIIRRHGGAVTEINCPYSISDQLMISGPVERSEPCEINETFVRLTGTKIVVDEFQDDMSIIVNLGKEGLFVITGCCHAGIINTVKHCRKITGEQKIKGILGGLHLINASVSRMDTTRNFLKTLACDFIAPIHCSGLTETCFLRNELGESVKFLGVGQTIRVV